MSRRQTDWLPRMRALAPNRASTLAVLDIGSNKVGCMIARLKPQRDHGDLPQRSHSVQVLGLGQQRSTGVKRGTIVDMENAERAIRLAVDSAERMAGVTVDSVVASISAGRLTSSHFAARVSVGGEAVSGADVHRVLEAGRAYSVSADEVVLHSLPIAYSLDDANGVRDPRGMVGRELGVDMHLVTAQAWTVRNLVLCIERCHLDVEAVVAAPYAAGLGSLVADELELGSACIDMGGGTTTFGVFAYGGFVCCDAIAIGGHHVTMDLARGLSTSIEAAERIKTLYGSTISGGADLGESISVPEVGEEDSTGGSNQFPRSLVTEIIRARVEEILEMVRDRLAATPFSGLAGKRAVLTGGASQLPGTVELAEQVLGYKVRTGRPLGANGLPDSARGAAFAVPLGLALFPAVAGRECHEPGARRRAMAGGYFARVGNWIRESF